MNALKIQIKEYNLELEHLIIKLLDYKRNDYLYVSKLYKKIVSSLIDEIKLMETYIKQAKDLNGLGENGRTTSKT